VPMPYNAKLEQHVMPQADRVIKAVKRVVSRSGRTEVRSS
jgi:pyruvate/2-oxoglutarate/acetoin dehydrogenase E1 component